MPKIPDSPPRRTGAAAAKLRCERGRVSIGPPQPPEPDDPSCRPSSRNSTVSLYSRRFRAAMDLCLRAFGRSFMRRVAPVVLSIVLLGAAPNATPPRGFFEESLDAERKVEREFLALPDPSVARESMRRLAAAPHHLGSAQGAKNAEWILGKFKEWGLDAHIETYDVLFPTPKERVLELVEPSTFRATLAETPLREDPTSSQTAEQLPTYNAYSIDGDVTAPLVYVNYGVPDDYDRLERLGVDVRGKIVIARYGGGWRGIKPKVAAEKG